MKDGKSGSNTLADKGAESAEDAGEMGLRAGLALGRAFLLYLAKNVTRWWLDSVFAVE